MMNPAAAANDMVPPPSSPTNSSVSSSDLDTESTGSFFHDRSTTLGTLMGVTFPSITFRPPPLRHHPSPTVSSANPSQPHINKKKKTKNSSNRYFAVIERRHRRRWWMICRDDAPKPASLGEFLEVERRFGDGGFYGGSEAAELEDVVLPHHIRPSSRNGVDERLLFADGRVLPPVEVVDDGSSSASAHICPFPVSLAGICSCVGVS